MKATMWKESRNEQSRARETFEYPLCHMVNVARAKLAMLGGFKAFRKRGYSNVKEEKPAIPNFSALHEADIAT